jgi:hypothetical protein
VLAIEYMSNGEDYPAPYWTPGANLPDRLLRDHWNYLSGAYASFHSKFGRDEEIVDHIDRIDLPLGSNHGGIFCDAEGREWYVKSPISEDRARNEVLANLLRCCHACRSAVAIRKIPIVEAQHGELECLPGLGMLR